MKLDLQVEQYEDKLFNTKITVNYGHSVLSEECLELYGECLSTSFFANEEYAYDKGENTVYVHIRPEVWEEDKDKIIESMRVDAEWVYTHQLVQDKEIYWTFYILLEHYLLEHDDPHANDTSFIWDCADTYEQNMETCNLEYLNNLCFEEIVEDILKYIEERFPYD